MFKGSSPYEQEVKRNDRAIDLSLIHFNFLERLGDKKQESYELEVDDVTLDHHEDIQHYHHVCRKIHEGQKVVLFKVKR